MQDHCLTSFVYFFNTRGYYSNIIIISCYLELPVWVVVVQKPAWSPVSDPSFIIYQNETNMFYEDAPLSASCL